MKIRRLADLPLEAVHGGAARKRVLIRYGEASSPLVYLNEAYLPPGADVERHTHADMEEVFYLLEGEGVMEISGESGSVRAGDRVIVPAGQLHYIQNTGSRPMRIISFGVQVSPVVGSPQRE